MSKLYGRMWNEKMSMATKAAHREITAQLLYGGASDPKIGAEVTMIAAEGGKFVLVVSVTQDANVEIRKGTLS